MNVALCGVCLYSCSYVMFWLWCALVSALTRVMWCAEHWEANKCITSHELGCIIGQSKDTYTGYRNCLWHRNYFLQHSQQTRTKTAIELMHNFLGLLLYFTWFMPSIWLWSSLIRKFYCVTETVQISSVSILGPVPGLSMLLAPRVSTHRLRPPHQGGMLSANMTTSNSFYPQSTVADVYSVWNPSLDHAES